MSLYEKMYNMWGESTQAEQIAALPILSPAHLERLQQLVTPVYDGNLISKSHRSELVDKGLVARCDGINFCTQDGYVVLKTLGYLSDSDKFIGGKPWKTSQRKNYR
jgi:hypothetical protein